ncbi:hypothetical protein DFH09DRAFT_1105636 [Mycena vulgaris]|nr:hypothetical protein DFH09DRAFT_1105636 [Mycena vulgaris]
MAAAVPDGAARDIETTKFAYFLQVRSTSVTPRPSTPGAIQPQNMAVHPLLHKCAEYVAEYTVVESINYQLPNEDKEHVAQNPVTDRNDDSGRPWRVSRHANRSRTFYEAWKTCIKEMWMRAGGNKSSTHLSSHKGRPRKNRLTNAHEGRQRGGVQCEIEQISSPSESQDPPAGAFWHVQFELFTSMLDHVTGCRSGEVPPGLLPGFPLKAGFLSRIIRAKWRREGRSSRLWSTAHGLIAANGFLIKLWWGFCKIP